MTVAVDNAELIREGYRRFAAQDVPGVLALFSPDIVWEIPGPQALAGEYVGHAGVGELFGAIAETWDRLEVRPLEFLADGPRVVVIGQHLIELRGASHEVPFVHAWTIEDGLASSFREYSDTALFERLLEG